MVQPLEDPNQKPETARGNQGQPSDGLLNAAGLNPQSRPGGTGTEQSAISPASDNNIRIGDRAPGITSDNTNTYSVPKPGESYQAVKNFGDNTKVTGSAQSIDLKLANGSTVQAIDSFDRGTGQHTYIMRNPETGNIQAYKPVDRNTLQAVDGNGRPTGEGQMNVRPNQLVVKEAQEQAQQKTQEQNQQKAFEQNQQKVQEQTQQKSLEQTQQKSQEQAQQKSLEGNKAAEHRTDGKDNPANQIDGKLLAQLQSLGRLPDVRSGFVDLINKFQDGRLSADGKDGGVFSTLHGMKPGELDGLKAWMTDGKKNPFDFKGLDSETQKGISQVFDTLLGRGQEKSTGAMFDIKGMREGLADSISMMTRTLGGEKGQTDFKVNIKDLDPSLLGIIGRLQGNEIDNAARDKALNSTVGGKEGDAKPGLKLSEAALDAINRFGDVTRQLGPREADTQQNKVEATLDTRTKAPDSKDDAPKAPEGSRGQELTPEQIKTLLETQRNRELEEAAQKKREEEAEQERQEKEKQDQQKKQDDEERIHSVQPNETLNSISEKFFSTKDYAQIIYDRNLENIMLQEHKHQTYAKLYPKQKLVIPNGLYVDKFKKSTKSHSHINFGKPDYASADEELMALFGKKWSGSATDAAVESRPAIHDEAAPVRRRRFSGNSAPLPDTDRRAHVRASLGLLLAREDNKPMEKHEKHEKDEKHHHVLLGESLRSIALKLYKSPSYWRLLCLKNDLSLASDAKGNPLVQLRRGQQLTLPELCEVQSYSRNPASPAVIALFSNERGLHLPRKRQCGFCHRETLAMAINCVACGLDMDTFAPEVAEGEEKHSRPTEQPATVLNAMANVVEQVATVQLQEVVLTNKFQPMNFSPENQNQHQHQNQPQPQQEQAAVSQPQPLHDPHPLPHADLSEVEFGFEQEYDPMWTASKEPVFLEQSVRIIECETMEQDVRGLIVLLQLLSEGQWVTVFDYHIRPDEVVIHKYQRRGGRRMMKKSLPAKQSKHMAWNHFRANWQSICSEFWTA